MVSTTRKPSNHPLTEIIDRLESGGALLPDSPDNVIEVVGVLKSYAVVLDAYWRNLTYISQDQFLVLFPFFKYFNGDVSFNKLLKHWWHDRINYEFAEYCMKAMMWHGGGGLDKYLDSPQFEELVQQATQAKLKRNLPIRGLAKAFPEFIPEQIRQLCYYSALGQFWNIMSKMFFELSDRYDAGEIRAIPDVVAHVKDGLVNAASVPITYAVKIGDSTYEIIPKSANLTFLMDAAVPYVEAVFLKSFPFMGTVSYNAQAQQISPDTDRFNYGVLYADPLPTGGAGIPPTLLMQDLRHYLPDYLRDFYQVCERGETDLRVRICISFQKSMFCVTTAAILGLMPFAIDTSDLQEQQANRKYLEGWMNRLMDSRLPNVQVCEM
ncbi:CO2 hydration protein [Phormidesmis sp. 146-35]